MKLYTRDQMIEAMRFVFMHDTDETPVEFIDTLTPIELPSDEEAEEYIDKFIGEDSYGDECKGFGFFRGFEWVIEKIKQQDNDTNTK